RLRPFTSLMLTKTLEKIASYLFNMIFVKRNTSEIPLDSTQFSPALRSEAQAKNLVDGTGAHCLGPGLWGRIQLASKDAWDQASRPFGGELEKVWMKTENLLLSSLPRGPVRPPGNGCTNTGNGGNPCIGSRKLASRVGGVAAPSKLLATHTNV
ncbi:hypothetical protein Tco_0397143, partial [Tanacetum coccineum]